MAPSFPSFGGAAKNIAANGDTQVKTGPGVFLGMSINTPGSGGNTVTVYDGTDNSGTKLGAFSTAALGGPNIPAAGIGFKTGLFVSVASGVAADVTVVYG